MNKFIKEKKLSELDVWTIVNEWYLDGMYRGLLKDEDGEDLEETLMRVLE